MQVGRHLKALGLRRGILTEEQTARLKELFEEHRGRRQCYQLIADGLENGCATVSSGSCAGGVWGPRPEMIAALRVCSACLRARAIVVQDVEGPGGEPAAQAGPEARAGGRPPLRQRPGASPGKGINISWGGLTACLPVALDNHVMTSPPDTPVHE